MAVRFSNLACKPIFWLLMFLTIFSMNSFGQKKLSGNFNQPFAHVTSIFDADEVDVDDASKFAAGDTILLIQMQGVGILTDPGVYGNYQTSFGTPGGYEFLIIDGKSGNRITFRNNIINSYDTRGNIQLVRVPYYISATVTGDLSCNPWDPSTGKGGVLALILGRTISLNADIDLTGKGLRGAPVTAGDGVPRNIAGTTGSSYPSSFTNAGNKGEGIAIHDQFGVLLYPAHAKGEGKNYTGGGGGNGKYSGGGGGSFRGDGGRGGFENFDVPQLGGLGGIEVGGSLLGRIFMGGGGGSSTSMSGAGGNGGGIVIIVTDSVIGNGHRISVNGAKGGDAAATGGAGGAGAAGTIALSLSSYGTSASQVNLLAAGGKGGNNPASFGEGGGGGGGLIYVSRETTSNVLINTDGGNAGDPAGGATAGTAGDKKIDFKVLLNGFLFNSIRSSVTGNDIDSVCSNKIPPAITGTTPVGGTAPYTYKWEKSYDKISWTTILVDNSSINYTPSAPETTTVYYRRVITDSSPTPLIDVSKEVKVIVQPYIKNNVIGSPQIICYNQDPVALVPTAAIADGNGWYAYKWEVSTDNVTYGTPASSYTSESYDPLALTASAWYKRTVTSGRCVDTSTPVSVTVLPDISNNKILNPDQDICYGMSFDNLAGSTASSAPGPLSGGDNNFRFKWESNINGAGWAPAPGLNDAADYNPGELTEKAPLNEYYFRRVVYSGLNDVCSATSNTVHLRDYPVITNNKISSPQTICSDAIPAILSGTTPLNGNGSYSYTWQDSSKLHSWTDIPGFIKSSSAAFQPPSLKDTTSYRRIAYSSACSDIGTSVRLNVHKPMSKYGISTLSLLSDTTICNGQDPFRLSGEISSGGTNLPGSYTYQWYSSENNTDFTPVAVSGTGTGYDPPALAATTYFMRETKSGACTVTSGSVKIEVLPLITNNVLSGSQTICFNSMPSQIRGAATAGGSGTYLYKWEESFDGGSTWVAATGSNNLADYTYPSALTVPGKFRRIVSSGRNNSCCSNTSDPVDVLIHPPLPTARIVSTPDKDTVFYSGTPVILKLSLTGSGPWKVTWTENSVPASDDVTVNNAELTINPDESGSETFEFLLKEVMDKNGCLASALSGKLIATVFPGFEIPEGFSPNGDGINDLFSIKGLNPAVPENQLIDMRIITSAGSEVFHTSNIGGQQWQEWDGRDSKGSDLAEGTYYYLMNIKTVLNGMTYKKSGFVILKR